MGGKYDPAVIVMMYTSPTHGANKTVRLFFCPEMGNIMELLFSHLRIYPIVNVTKCIIMFKRIKHINLKNVLSTDVYVFIHRYETNYHCDLSSFPMEYETIFVQSTLVRVTGNNLLKALNVVSDLLKKNKKVFIKLKNTV